MKTFYKKLEYRFLVESTKIENPTYPHKTGLSEANVKINRMGSTKWNCHKEQGFLNYFIFLKILFQYTPVDTPRCFNIYKTSDVGTTSCVYWEVPLIKS